MATLVLDASVAVAAARKTEPHHLASLACVQRILGAADGIVVPVIFEIEVTAALARRGVPAVRVRQWVSALLREASIVDLGRAEAVAATRVALRTHLRSADAIYVWLAASRALPLCTLDGDVRTRAAKECTVVAP